MFISSSEKIVEGYVGGSLLKIGYGEEGFLRAYVLDRVLGLVYI